MEFNTKNLEVVEEVDKLKEVGLLYKSIYSKEDYQAILTPFKYSDFSQEFKINVAYECLLSLKESRDHMDYIYCVQRTVRHMRIKNMVDNVKTKKDHKAIQNFIKKHESTLNQKTKELIHLMQDPMARELSKKTAIEICRELFKGEKYLRCLRHCMQNSIIMIMCLRLQVRDL